MFTHSQWRTLALHLVSIAGGAAASISFMASHSVDLYAIYDHLYAAVKEASAALTVLAPLASMAWGIYKASTHNKLVDATGDPGAVEAAHAIEPTPQIRAVAAALTEKP